MTPGGSFFSISFPLALSIVYLLLFLLGLILIPVAF